MNQFFYRSSDVIVSSLRDSAGNYPAFSIRTRRRSWLTDSIVLSMVEARAVAFSILRATFHAGEVRL